MTSVVDLNQFRRKTAAFSAVEPPMIKDPEALQMEPLPVLPAGKPCCERASKPGASRKGSEPLVTATAEVKPKEPRLTKPAREFRARFFAALQELKDESFMALAQAKTRADMKAKINVSLVLKRAKASPLTAYSPLHRDTLLPFVEAAGDELLKAIQERFSNPSNKRKSSISCLSNELVESRRSFEKQLATLASQKLSSYIHQD